MKIIPPSETSDKNKWSKFILKAICLSPILLWPFILYGSIFIFDDPNANPTHQYAAFYGINSYPIFIIVTLLIANKLYRNNYKISIALYLLPIILMSLGISFFIF